MGHKRELIAIAAASLALSGAAAQTINGNDFTSMQGIGMKLVVDVTAISGTTPGLTVVIEGKDPISGKYYTILSSAVITAVSTVVLNVYPGLTAAANLKADDIIPTVWRVKAVVTGTGITLAATVVATLLH
jgi:hypothetical protein